jgi:hypothetical protein
MVAVGTVCPNGMFEALVFMRDLHRLIVPMYCRKHSQILLPGEVIPPEFDRSGCGYRNGKVRLLSHFRAVA